MKRIDLGVSGENPSPNDAKWKDVGLAAPWQQIVELFAPNSSPSDIQVEVLGKLKALETRRNLIISSPTNSGKSLLGYLALFEALKQGRRALLLEPLRAIAQEKFDELTRALPSLSAALGREVGLSITTGDYRVEEEMMHSPPPEGGELVIATPERLEAILRNPDFDATRTNPRICPYQFSPLQGSPSRSPPVGNDW